MHMPHPHPGQWRHPSLSSTKVPHSGQFLIAAFVIGLAVFPLLPLPANTRPLSDSFTIFFCSGLMSILDSCFSSLAFGAKRTWSLMLESLNTVASLHPSL